jgi:hypothetical protein
VNRLGNMLTEGSTRREQCIDVFKYEHAKFHPWIGQRYQDCAPWGFRAMVLGESHYDTDGAEPADFTNTVVRRVVNCQDKRYRTRLFTKTARLFLWAAEERTADREECRAFWQNVLFYNFIQQYVAKEPRIRPTKAMWEDSANTNAFEEVVHAHRPDLILVLGKELSLHLQTCRAKLRKGISFVEIHHPQSRGWKYDAWMQSLRTSIEQAKSQRLHRAGILSHK